MAQTVVPMIHVPDVRVTVQWYVSIGFACVGENVENGQMNWAKLAFEGSEVMFNFGGRPSPDQRRELDLYITTNTVDELFRRLKDRMDVVEDVHDTEYGMREFIIRDCNRFWITFGQSVRT
jgi:hypothetical protein